MSNRNSLPHTSTSTRHAAYPSNILKINQIQVDVDVDLHNLNSYSYSTAVLILITRTYESTHTRRTCILYCGMGFHFPLPQPQFLSDSLQTTLLPRCALSSSPRSTNLQRSQSWIHTVNEHQETNMVGRGFDGKGTERWLLGQNRALWLWQVHA